MEFGNIEALLKTTVSLLADIKCRLDRPAANDEVLTVKDVASLLQLSPKAVRERVKMAGLPAYKIGPSSRGRKPELRFRRSEVIKWLISKKKKGPAALEEMSR